ncbi:MAG: hypothetical protein NVSMB9_19550 [Isosphaeraceae bacterium]
MPVFDQGYQHWEGKLSGHEWRWLAIARQGVRQQMNRKRTRWLISLAFTPALVLAGFLIFWGLLEQQSIWLQPVMFLVDALPEDVRVGPKAYRYPVWTMAYHAFFTVETFFAMLVVLTVGPDLVSQDLRFNAMPLYFSRPVRRFDYYLGKLGVIAVFLLAVMVGPAAGAYLLGVAFSMDLGVIRDTWRILAASLAYGLVVVVSAGTLMLAVSSLSRNSRLVGATWIGLWIVSNVTADVLTLTVKRDWCPLVSYTANLDRIREEIFDTATAREKFLQLWEAGRETGRRAAQAMGPFARFRARRKPPTPRSPDLDKPPLLLRMPPHMKNPWTRSAGVLAGLFALSAWALSTRVKSMDRLK